MEAALVAVQRRRDALTRLMGDFFSAEQMQEMSGRIDASLEKMRKSEENISRMNAETAELKANDPGNRENLRNAWQEAGLVCPHPASNGAAAVVAPPDALAASNQAESVPTTSRQAEPVAADLTEEIHVIRTISMEEFNSIPKYMRGRMTCDEINELVTSLDRYLQEKRSLLNQQFRRLNARDKDRVTKWKEQETAATGRCLFVVQSEFEGTLTGKARHHSKAVLTCLRHLKRTRELRDKGNTFLFVI